MSELLSVCLICFIQNNAMYNNTFVSKNVWKSYCCIRGNPERGYTYFKYNFNLHQWEFFP